MMETLSVTGFQALPWFSQLSLALGAGILSCLTPCVYPLIPITVATFSDQGRTSRLRSAALAGLYMLGLVVTYTTLGIAAGAGGLTFGFILSNPAALLFISAILALLALHSLGIWEMSLFSVLQIRAGRIASSGAGGIFVTGALSGLVAAPCIGPVLAVVLSAAAATQSVTHATSLLFAYSLGLGLPVFLLAFFSELLGRLPRSGAWMRSVHFMTASALVLVIMFLLQHYLSPLTGWCAAIPAGLRLLGAPLLFAAGLFSYWTDRKLLRLTAAIGLAVALCPLFLAPAKSSIGWHARLETALQEALLADKPVMLDFYADWCAGCKELDFTTFENSEVRRELQNFVLARIDLTISSDYADEITARFDVPGLPTIIFLRPDGQEIELSRISGYIPARQFAAHLREVLR